ncbi:hypothetical protein CLU79DRAFT_771232 [Phycomyces nitens]|nr:hypothetical protein CLU79DRAFT_771232 [Phycomyces nitens]
MYTNDEPSVFVCANPFRIPFRMLSGKGRQFGVYASSAMIACGWWCFMDAVIQASTVVGATPMGFEDWFSGILTTFGMIVVNMIDKSRLYGEASQFDSVAWKARLFLFVGFALMAGGLAGSICTLIIKYVIHLDSNDIYFGIAGVIQNALIMLSAMVLWMAQSAQGEFVYDVQI